MYYVILSSKKMMSQIFLDEFITVPYHPLFLSILDVRGVAHQGGEKDKKSLDSS